MNRIIPDKEGREKFFAELEREYRENEHEYDMALLQDVADARATSTKELTPYDTKFTINMKGSVRPFVTYIIAGLYTFGKIWNTIQTKTFVFEQKDFMILLGIIGFYFGLREIGKALKKNM